jgi:hypothetical protein
MAKRKIAVAPAASKHGNQKRSPTNRREEIAKAPAAKRKQSKYNREQIADLLREGWRSTWVIGLHAGLMKADAAGLLPEQMICGETIEWHSPKVCYDETNKLFDCLDALGEALGIDGPLFGDVDREAEFARPYLADIDVKKPSTAVEGGAT